MSVEKVVFTTKDIMEMFSVKQTKASELIQAIKSVSDITGITGRVHKLDYEKWIQAKSGVKH